MKCIIYLLILIIAEDAYGASFVSNGTTISSKITQEIIECENYKIIIEQETFPQDYENVIPVGLSKKGFFGPSYIIEAKAYLSSKKVKKLLIPPPLQVGQESKYSLKNRVYLPSSGNCKGDTFQIIYWSGGNCDKCEATFEYQLNKEMKIVSKTLLNSK